MKKLLFFLLIFPCYAFAQQIPAVNDTVKISGQGAAFTVTKTFGFDANGNFISYARRGTSNKWDFFPSGAYLRRYYASKTMLDSAILANSLTFSNGLFNSGGNVILGGSFTNVSLSSNLDGNNFEVHSNASSNLFGGYYTMSNSETILGHYSFSSGFTDGYNYNISLAGGGARMGVYRVSNGDQVSIETNDYDGYTGNTIIVTDQVRHKGLVGAEYFGANADSNTYIQKRYVDSLKSTSGDKVYVTPDQYGAVGDGITNDAVAINAALASNYTVIGTPGKVYKINSSITVSDGKTFIGNGATIKFSGIPAFIPGNNSTIEGVNFKGNKHNASSTSEIGILIRGKINVLANKNHFDSVATASIQVDSTAGAAGFRVYNILSNNSSTNSTVHVKFGNRGEYAQLIGGWSKGCDTAIVRIGGNAYIEGGIYNDGGVGLYDAGAGTNSAHAIVKGAIFNHNTYALIANGIPSTVGNMYVGCSFQVGKIPIINSKNLTFSGCVFGFIATDSITNDNSSIEIIGSQFGATPHYTEINAGTHKFYSNTLKYTATTAEKVLFESAAILASADYLNQGTTTTVLHGNASGNPSWGAVNLATDVTGQLPAANGTNLIANNTTQQTSANFNVSGSGVVGAGLTATNSSNTSLFVNSTAASISSGRAVVEINTSQTSNVTTGGVLLVKSNSVRAMFINGLGNMLLDKSLILTAAPSGTAGTDSLITKNPTTNVIGKIAASYYVASSSILSGSATLDFPSTASGSVSDLTITVTGAAVGDVVSLGIPANTATGRFFAWVSATNTVTVRYVTEATEDPASGTFKVKIFK